MKNSLYVISPSASVAEDTECKNLIDTAQKNLDTHKIGLKYGPHFWGKKMYLAGNIEERVSDLHAAFLDSETQLVVTSQGGDSSNELLSALDFELIKKNYKPFFGMSDISVLLNAIFLETGLVTYHGIDLVWGLGKNGGPYTYTELENFFHGTFVPFENLLNQSAWRVVKEGTGRGVLFGGCLSSLILLLGTRFDPLAFKDDYVLFLEDIFEKPQRLSAYFRQLSLHKNIQNCRGIILGNFFLCEDDAYTGTIEDLAKESFGDLNIPIIKIPEIGHAVENMIMPIGQKVEIVGTGDVVSIKAIV